MIKKFKQFLLFLITFLLFNSIAFAEIQKVKISDFSGGMVTNVIEDALGPNQGASMVNVVLNRPGKISKRKGQALFNQDVGNTAHTGIGRFDPDANTSYLVIASGVSVARSQSGDTSWTIANPSNALTTGKNTEFVQANDLLFVLNGTDNTAWYNGSFWDLSTTYPTSPPTASTGAWLRNYLFLAGATTENDWVYFSNNLDPKTFTTGDIIKINTGDGQKIQHLEPFRLNELIIYKERSVFVLDITGSTPLINWTVQPISTTIGTIAPRSVVSLGNDQWFLSSEPIAIRSLVRSNFDKILLDFVSAPIQDIIEGTHPVYQLNKNQASKAASVLFDNKFLMAIATGTSLENDLVLVYDFISKGWYLITGWAPRDWVVFNNRLYYIDAYDGRVLECFTGNVGDFASGPSVTPAAPTQGIDFTYISRAIEFDLPENFKKGDAVEIELSPTGNWNANVYINYDSDGWSGIGTVNLAGNSLTLPVTLPAVLDNGGLARKTFQIQKYGEFKKMKIMVQNQASGQTVELNRSTIFADPKPWRRE